MTSPTPAQQRVLDFVQAEIQAGRPSPTHREIASRLHFRSPRAAACHLEALKKKGLIEWGPGKARSLRVISALATLRNQITDIPLFGSIPAGLSDERVQEPDGCVS